MSIHSLCSLNHVFHPQLNMNLAESNARCEVLQEALVRTDLLFTQVGDRNEDLEGQLKQVCRPLFSVDLYNHMNNTFLIFAHKRMVV